MSLKELREKGRKRLELDQLPAELVATLTNWRFDKDSRGRECLFIDLEDKDGNTVTQKYTSLHITDFADAIEQLGFDHLDKAKGKTFIWKLKTYRIGNPRLIPEKLIAD